MVHAAWYPPANRSQDRSQFSGINMPQISKCLLHSTETQGWPSYPTFAPQFTYNPWTHQWRQHMPLPRSASTLADPSWTAIRENRDNIVQVEIIGYCDPQRWPVYGKNVEQMDSQAINDLGQFIAWLHVEWEVPLTAIPTELWVGYPKSYGVNAPQRLSESAFDRFTGVLGHQHACGNSHGDPGRINIDAIMAAAKGTTPVPAYPRPTNNNVYLSKLKLGQSDSDSVWQLQNALNKLIATGEVDANPLPLTGYFGKQTAETLAKAVFQTADIPVDIINDL